MKYKIKDVISSSITGQWGEDCNDNNGTPVFGVSNLLKNGKIDFSKLAYRNIEPNKLSTSYVKNGDILIAKSGNPKVCYYQGADDLYCACNFILTLRSNTEIIESKYLYYAIKQLFLCGDINRCYTSTTIPNLSTKSFFDYSIDVPSKEKQLLVVNQLTKLDMLTEYRETQLSLFDELIKARFVELMDAAELSEETTVESITERVKVGFVGTCERFYTDESGIPMLRTGNITEKGIDLKDLKYVTEEFHEKNKKSQIHEGDLLIARHGSNGQANVYYGPEAQCLNAVVIVPNQKVAYPVFLAGLINSPMVKEQIDKTLVGSTQHVVNTKSIASLKVRIPDLSVQKQYEGFVKQVDKKSKSICQKKLALYQELYDSLMQKYFGTI